MTDKPVSQVLSEAADLLEKPGAWGQDDYNPHDGCFCALGAIRVVGRYKGDDNAPATFLGDCIGEPWVCDWNDDPERTQTEVVAAFRRASALAKEQGR